MHPGKTSANPFSSSAKTDSVSAGALTTGSVSAAKPAGRSTANDSAGVLSTGYLLVYLMGCALNNQQPDTPAIEQAAECSDELLQLADRHSVSALTAQVLQGTKAYNNAWEEHRLKALSRTIQFETERTALYQFLDSEGIWYVPLKGILIQNFYPAYGTREFADNDILYDQERTQDVRQWFAQRGYDLEIAPANDGFIKSPCYNFEMHRVLFREHDTDIRDDFTSAIIKRLMPDGSGSRRRMTDEDAYVYFVCHADKHASNGGIGLRTLADFYTYAHFGPSDINRPYVEQECTRYQVLNFEQTTASLADKLFAHPNLSSLNNLSVNDQDVLDAFLFAGTYGQESTLLEQRLRSYDAAAGRAYSSRSSVSTASKIHYILWRLFPDDRFMLIWCECHEVFPTARQHHILLIPIRFYRLILLIPHGASKFNHLIRALWKK